MNRELKEQSRLRSLAGCIPCRQRRKKCDYSKPSCKECVRLKLECAWLPSYMALTTAVSSGLVAAKPRTKIPLEMSQSGFLLLADSQANQDLAFESAYARVEPYQGFDHPSVLRASPTSILEDPLEKQFHQFLWENGHRIFNIAAPMPSNNEHFNVLKTQYIADRSEPLMITVGNAIGGAFFAQINENLIPVARRYYGKCLRAVSSQIDLERDKPSVNLCNAVYYLTALEQVSGTEPRACLNHFLGLKYLINKRLDLNMSWQHSTVMLELYLYRVLGFCTFWGKIASVQISISYVDDVLEILNKHDRPLGATVVGVPEDLFALTYRLTYLRLHTLSDHEHSVELAKISNTLEEWEAPSILQDPAYSTRRTLARVYYNICKIYVTKFISFQDSDYSNTSIQSAVEASIEELNSVDFDVAPPLGLGWALVFLGLAVGSENQLERIKSWLGKFVSVGGTIAVKTQLHLIDVGWGNGPGDETYRGLNGLFDQDIFLQSATF